MTCPHLIAGDEDVPFARRPVADFLTSLNANPVLRMDKANPNQPFHTDENNIILDCHIGPIIDPFALAQALIRQPGVVEHGLFLGLANRVILAGPNGVVEMAHEG